MKIFTIIGFAAAAVVANPATAEPVRTDVRVSYADLSLASPAGQASLARRINAAALNVCSVDPNERDVAAMANSKRCYRAAVSGARTAVAMAKAPQLASR
jgi:UrcA family protein